MSYRMGLLCGGLLLQAAAVQAQVNETAEISPESAARADNSGRAGLEEIVVTANRREERLQDVPLSVTAITGNAIQSAGVVQTRDLFQVVPGLTFTRQTSSATPAIRGVTSVASSVGDEPNVAVYVDGIYQPVAASNIFDFVEIDRIEVLRGPQGTLFGRNATGGLVNIITKDPSQDANATATLSYGRFNDVSARAYANTGIGEGAAVNISLLAAQNDGYARNLLTGGREARRKTWAARGKLLLEPTDRLKIVGALAYNYVNDTASTTSQPFKGNTQGRQFDPDLIIATKPNTYAGNEKPGLFTRQYTASLQATYQFDGVTLASASAYSHDFLFQNNDSDASSEQVLNAFQDQTSDTFSQEIRLLSDNDSALKWIVGGYFFDFKGDSDVFLRRRPSTPVTNLQPKAYGRSYALFAEGTYSFSDAIKLTVGGRYTWETKRFRQTINGNFMFDVKRSYEQFTPRASLQYYLTPTSNIYVSYSKGFKSGAFATVSTNPNATDPEDLTAYEVGLKADLTSWLRANLSAFHYDFKDLQVSARDANAQSVLRNAATAKISGGEAEIVARATPELTLRFAGTYLHGRYSKFTDAVLFTPRPNDSGNMQFFGDASGNRVIRSPEYTLNLTADYEKEIEGGWVGFSTNIYHSARIYYDFSERVSQKPYTVLNGNIFWTTPDKDVKISIWGTNLLNQHYALSINATAPADLIVYDRPRSYGVSITRNF